MSSPPQPSTPSSGRAYGGVGPEERRERRRAAFLDAGLELIGSIGYRQTTIRALSREAGLTDRYFYESFANMEALLVALHAAGLERVERAVMAGIDGCAPDVAVDVLLRAAIDGFLDEFENRRLARLMWIEVLGVSQEVDVAYRGGVRRFAGVLIREATARFPQLLTDEPARELVAIALIGAVSETAVQWLITDYAEPRERVAAALVDVFVGVGLVNAARAAAQQQPDA